MMTQPPYQLLFDYWNSYLSGNKEVIKKATEACFSKDVVFIHNNDTPMNFDILVAGSMAIADGRTFVAIEPTTLGVYDFLPVKYTWYGTLYSANIEDGAEQKNETYARVTALFAPRENGTKIFYMQISPNAPSTASHPFAVTK